MSGDAINFVSDTGSKLLVYQRQIDSVNIKYGNLLSIGDVADKSQQGRLELGIDLSD